LASLVGVEQSPYHDAFSYNGDAGKPRKRVANAPSFVVTHKYPAFLGLMEYLRREVDRRAAHLGMDQAYDDLLQWLLGPDSNQRPSD